LQFNGLQQILSDGRQAAKEKIARRGFSGDSAKPPGAQFTTGPFQRTATDVPTGYAVGGVGKDYDGFCYRGESKCDREGRLKKKAAQV
jgi:hypothetical protein